MRVKCNFDPESVDLAEILQYGCKPPDASDMFKEGVFKKSGAHKGEGKSSRSDQMRCFRLKNHLLFYYQQDSLPILDKNVAGVIVLLNVFISRGLMTSTDSDYPFVLRLSTDQQSKMKVYELRSKDIKQRDEWFEAIQSVILNPPVGGGTNPQGAAWPSSAKIAHCELISQGVRCPPSARLKPKSICDHHFLSLSFSEMHVKLLAQSNGVLESSAALQKWQEQIKETRSLSLSTEEKACRSKTTAAAASLSAEHEATVSSRLYKSGTELYNAYNKHRKYIAEINQNFSTPHLL